DRTAEGDLAVALAEVQVAHRETGAGHVDREVDLRAAREVLDVAIAAVLARRHGARAFGADLVLDVALGAAAMGGWREWRVRQAGHAGRVGRDQLGLALVPGVQHLRIGQTADQAGMDQAREIDAGYVARRGV